MMLPLAFVRTSAMAVLLILPLLGDGGLNRVRTANTYALAAQAAFQKGNNAAAIQAYEKLAALGPLPEEAQLNLAHAYFRAGQRSKARTAYAALSTSKVAARRATALGQLGLLAAAEQNYDRALNLLRTALRTDARATVIRYNYEVLARWVASNPEGPLPGMGAPPGTPQSQRPKKQPQSGPAEEQPDGAGQAPRGEGDRAGGGDRATEDAKRDEQRARGNSPGDRRGESSEADPNRMPGADGRAGNGTQAADAASRRIQTLRARPAADGLPPQQALMILDAMRAAEAQYLQQVRRTQRKAADPTKPDW